MSGASGSIATTDNTSFDIKKQVPGLLSRAFFFFLSQKFTRPPAGEQPEAAS